ncbi:hypothetical protein SETIT_2G246600v2 [Setaria italica]|uniref:BTB domain-containing protein n=1 Tax=Setaria italica TaxID=4555 RepID=A0A368Q2N8_SETIT|nr:hypothetical protein SETIT_2G246600v2 [Setaria italica]
MDGFAWTLDSFVTVRFSIEDHEPTSIKPSFATRSSIQQDTCSGFACMLQENIPTDITITTSNGSIRAHSNVLSACSPQLSAVHIPDMSIDECQCFINYMYGNLQERDFIAHRVALLGAAEKYDVSDLKVACVDSLSQDIDTENLIERLQVADFYQLQELKRSCIRLLVDFMKVYEIHDDFNEFIKTADTDLVVEILQHVLGSKLAGVF